MGNFYVNVTLKAERMALKTMLDHIADRSVIGPEADGWLTFSSAALEQQEQETIDAYGEGVSKHVAGPVIAALNHDDDILSIDVYEGGVRTATYNSCPGYFSESPTEADLKPRLTNPDVFDALAPDAGISALLNDRPVFAVEAHAAFAKAAGLPPETAGFGFRYAERGEFDALDLTWAGRANS